ncbi:MAG: DUF2269 family protein [Gammaproteobacteria bacterium]
MSYELLKTLHILSAIMLFGMGLGTVFYKMMADRSGNLAAIAVTSRLVVLADWLFTTPTVIFQPLSGIWLAARIGYPLDAPWLLASYVLYAVAGICWLPVVALQIRMRDSAAAALASGTALPEAYRRDSRTWMWLGVPAFFAMVAITAIMVFHHQWRG